MAGLPAMTSHAAEVGKHRPEVFQPGERRRRQRFGQLVGLGGEFVQGMRRREEGDPAALTVRRRNGAVRKPAEKGGKVPDAVWGQAPAPAAEPPRTGPDDGWRGKPRRSTEVPLAAWRSAGGPNGHGGRARHVLT